MEKVMEFKHNNDVFIIKGKFGDTCLELVDVEVVKNDKNEYEFGHTFAGHEVDNFDFAEQSLRAYINDSKEVEFTFVHDTVKQYKKDNQTFNDKGIPEKWFREFCECPLVAYNNELAYYMDEDGYEQFVCTDIEKNKVVTDYENFFISAIVEDYKKNNLTFADLPYTDEVKEWIKEMAED